MKTQHILYALFFAILLIACSSSTPQSKPTPTLNSEQTLGKQVYNRHCAACHLLTPDDIKVGPSFYGLADRVEMRVTGQDARTYLLTSVLNPSDYVVEGFEDLMTKGLAKELTGEELDAVIAYLQTLHEIR